MSVEFDLKVTGGKYTLFRLGVDVDICRLSFLMDEEEFKELFAMMRDVYAEWCDDYQELEGQALEAKEGE